MYGGYVLAQNSEMRACLYAIHPERPQSRSRSVSLMGKVDDIFWEGENVNNTLTYFSYPETRALTKKMELGHWSLVSPMTMTNDQSQKSCRGKLDLTIDFGEGCNTDEQWKGCKYIGVE